MSTRKIYISLIESNNVISQKNYNFELTPLSETSTYHISTCKIARTVALNNPIAPYVFNRNEETKFSLVKNLNF